MRKTIIAGNWKMHKTLEESQLFINELTKTVPNTSDDLAVIVAPPYTSLATAKEQLQNSSIALAAQNMSEHVQGAHTGDVSVEMLKSCGCTHIIIGHSERRKDHNEDNQLLNQKLALCLDYNIVPIYCVGESLAQREQGQTLLVIETQLREGLKKIDIQKDAFVIAYEPVWAIGTGKVATPSQANEVHQFIRAFIAENYSQATADQLPLLYGGSVKSDNIESLLEMQHIDGALIGGASLKTVEFSDIITKTIELKGMNKQASLF